MTGAGLPIVVGVDPSDSARDAALWAADLAAARGCGMELVHIAATRPHSLPAWLPEVVDAAERAGAVPVAAQACAPGLDEPRAGRVRALPRGGGARPARAVDPDWCRPSVPGGVVGPW